MELSLGFLFAICFAVAHGASMKYEMKLMESKTNRNPEEFQATKPSTLRTTSTGPSHEDIQIAQMNFQANRLQSGSHQEDSRISLRSQTKSSMYPRQSQMSKGSPSGHDRSMFQSQQQVTPSSITTIQPQANDFPSQQPYYPENQQFPQQQQMYGNIEDSKVFGEIQFRDTPDRDLQIRSDLNSMKSYGASQGPMQLSAFDNREQPIVLPRFSHSSSASVIVSGLKNLPLLPAMVYNAGEAPLSHSTYIPDSWYQGSASIPQMGTPYVRYVYSHIL